MTGTLARLLISDGPGGVPLHVCFPELHLVAPGPLEDHHAARAATAGPGSDERAAYLCCAALGAIGGGRPGKAAALAASASASADVRWFSDCIARAARSMQVNWWPEQRGSDLMDLGGEPPAGTAQPGEPADAVVALAGRALGLLETRRIVRATWANTPPTFRQQVAAVTGGFLGELRGIADDSGVPLGWLSRLADLLEAELQLRLFGAPGQPVQPAPGPPAAADGGGAAECIDAAWDLFEGDAGLVPGSILESSPTAWAGRDRPALEAALTHYRAAAARYAGLDAPVGLALTTLRLALIESALAREPVESRFLEADRLARVAGDHGARWMVRTQQTLTAIHLGQLWPQSWAVADDDLATWAATYGSPSYAAGIAEQFHTTGVLLDALGDIERASCALRTGIAAAEVLQRHDGPNSMRSLRMQAALADAQRRRGLRLPSTVLFQRRFAVAKPEAFTDTVQWLELADAALGARGSWLAERNPAGLEAVGCSIAVLVDRHPADLGTGPAAWVLSLLNEALTEHTILVPLYRALALEEGGRTDEARALFDEARTAADRLADPRLQYIVHGTRRDGPAARLALQRTAAGSGLDPDLVLSAAVNIGDWQQAHALLDHAGERPDDPPWEGFAIRAEVELHVGAPAEALAIARQGADVFEATLNQVVTDLLRTSLTDSSVVRQLYTAGAAAAVAVDRSADGLSLVDWLRAAPMLGTLEVLDQAPIGSEAVVRSWLRAMSEWSAVFERARSRPSEAPGDTVEVEAALTHAEMALERAAPGLIGRAVLRHRPERLAEAQGALLEGEVLVELHAANDELLIWVMAGHHTEGVRITVATRQLMALSRRLLRWCSSGVGGDDLVAEMAATILAPVADAVAGHPRLLVSAAGGGLNALPIHLLPLGARPLCEQTAVSYLPAASLIPVLRSRGRRPGSGDVLVVGACDYAPETRLPYLPGTRREAVEVARIHEVEPFLGPEAVHPAVNERLRSADVIHLASHGIFDEAAPSASRIALSGGDALTVSDLVASPMAARLVVLSACDTGRGRATLGGDVAGLTRALLTAGAAGCLVSLWQVDDELAADQMIAFHRHLAAGADPASALAGAYTIRATAGDPAAGARPARRDLGDEAEDTEENPGRPAWAAFVHVGL